MWSEKFLARGKKKGYKKLFVGKENIPKAEECEKAMSGEGNKNKEIKSLGNFNKVA